MNGKQAKRIRKILGDVSTATSKRLYRRMKKAFKAVPPSDKPAFLFELAKEFSG